MKVDDSTAENSNVVVKSCDAGGGVADVAPSSLKSSALNLPRNPW